MTMILIEAFWLTNYTYYIKMTVVIVLYYKYTNIYDV